MPIPTGYAQANFRYTGTGVPTGAEWTLGLNLEGGGLTPAQVAEDLHGFYDAADFHTECPSSIALSSVMVKFGPDSTGPSGIFTGAVTGTGSTATAPNCSWLVHKNTPNGGRAGRGRLYLPGVEENAVGVDGDMDDTTQALLQASFDAFWTAIGGSTFSPVVLHGEGSPLSTPSVITSFTVDGKCATQRRRLRR